MVAWMPRFLLPLVFAGCASTYAYTFHSDHTDDADVTAAVRVDAPGQTVRLDVTNKTDQVLAVDWAKIWLTRADGSNAFLHPATDLGWLAPGETRTADLLPLVLPRHDDVAAPADNGRTFRLHIPMTVRHEPRVYRVDLVAQVKPQ
jgi:hypothetical protein